MKNFSLSDNIFLNNFNNKNFKSTTINNDSLNINEVNYKNNNKNNIFNFNSINQQIHTTPLNFKYEHFNKILNNNNKNLNESSSFQIKLILSSFPDSTEITTELKKIINSFLLDLYYYQQNLLLDNLLNSSFIQNNYFNDMKDNFNLYIIYLNISQNKIKTIGEFKIIFNNLFDIYYKIYKDNINNIQYLILKNFLEFSQKLLKKFEEKCLNNNKNNNNKFLIFKKEKKNNNNNEIKNDSKEKKMIKNKKMNICINKLNKNTEINNNLKLILLNILDQILFSKYGNMFNQIFESKNYEKNNEQMTINKLKQMINLNKIKTISEFKKKLFLIFKKIPKIIKKNSKNYKIIKNTFSLSKEILNKTYYHFDNDYSTKNPKKSKRKKNIKNIIFNITKIYNKKNKNNTKKEKENITNNKKEKNENLLENKITFNNKEREILLENISKLNDDGFIQLSNYLEKNTPEIIEISEIKNDLIRKMFYFNKLSLNKKEEVINFINILLTNDKNIIKD